MSLLLDGDKANPTAWDYQDEIEYNHLKLKYGNRKELHEEAANKRKALRDCEPDNPLYHRIAVSAEMAAMRVDYAYIVARNIRLEEMLGTVSFLHQRLDILEGSYGYMKMLAEGGRIDYATLTRLIRDVEKLKQELSNGAESGSKEPHGAKG